MNAFYILQFLALSNALPVYGTGFEPIDRESIKNETTKAPFRFITLIFKKDIFDV